MELAGLVAKAPWQVECADDPSDLRESVGEVLLGFAGPPPTPVLATEASELVTLLSRQRGAVRVGPVEADFA